MLSGLAKHDGPFYAFLLISLVYLYSVLKQGSFIKIPPSSMADNFYVIANQIVNNPKYKPLLAIIKGVRNGIM